MSKPRPKQIGLMKAKPITDELARALGPTCFAQPKLRGQHARVEWIDGDPILLSSYGNAFCFMDHIRAELGSLPKLPYCGELYYHHPEFTQQKINSICNRTVNPHPESEKIQFHIFDLAIPERQKDRIRILAEELPELDPANPNYTKDRCVQLVQTNYISSENWRPICANYLKHGYEGVILRSFSGLYSPLDLFASFQRPSCILKGKPTVLTNCAIIGVREGEGWAKGMLGAFLVVRECGGSSFYVGTGPELTRAKRRIHWENRDSLIGKILVVKHEPTSTADGIPICTSAYALKEAK